MISSDVSRWAPQPKFQFEALWSVAFDEQGTLVISALARSFWAYLQHGSARRAAGKFQWEACCKLQFRHSPSQHVNSTLMGFPTPWRLSLMHKSKNIVFVFHAPTAQRLFPLIFHISSALFSPNQSVLGSFSPLILPFPPIMLKFFALSILYSYKVLLFLQFCFN